MHKSRLGGLIIDCQTDDLEKAAEFWGKALGWTPKPPSGADAGKYIPLENGPDDLAVEVQRVDHASRVHIDIETDDIEAEVARLEALGARRVEKIRTWWVMEAPTGQRFCVIKAQKPVFEERAKRWD